MSSNILSAELAQHNVERAQRSAELERRNAELHDLCQPLTALMCRLELGRILGNSVALEAAVGGGLEETQRMFAVIGRIRQRLIADVETYKQTGTDDGSRRDSERAQHRAELS
jgi:hypothetical protein